MDLSFTLSRAMTTGADVSAPYMTLSGNTHVFL